MARMPNATVLESQVEVSGPCSVGRIIAGPGDAGEVSWPVVGQQSVGFLGNLTTAQRDALTGVSPGDWIFNTDKYGKIDRYNGTFWLEPSDIVLTNRTGSDTEEGKSWIVSPSYDLSFSNPGSTANIRACGVVKSGGIADGQDAVVSVDGIVTKVLMEAGDNTIRGNGLYTLANGQNTSASWSGDNTGCFGIALESKNDAVNPYSVLALLGLFAEVY